MKTIQIAVVNASSLADEDVANGIVALQRQVSDEFAPVWGVDAELHLVPKEQAVRRARPDRRAVRGPAARLHRRLRPHDQLVGHPEGTGRACPGWRASWRGDDQEAGERFAESLRIVETLDAPQYLVECLEGFACIAARRGRAERALRLAGAAAAIRESIGTPQPPWSGKLEEGWMPDARRRVGPAAARAREEGRKLTPEQAMALALESM